MTFPAFARANLARLLAGPIGESITYAPADGSDSYSISAIVDRQPFEREEFGGLEERMFLFFVLRDAPGTDPSTGVVTPVPGDRITVSRFPGSTDTVQLKLIDFERTQDDGWELRAIL